MSFVPSKHTPYAVCFDVHILYIYILYNSYIYIYTLYHTIYLYPIYTRD